MAVEDNIFLREASLKIALVQKAAAGAAQYIRDYNFSKTGKPPRSATKKEKDLYDQF